MILYYTYDKMKKIIEMFEREEICSIKIEKVPGLLNTKDSYSIEYIRFSELSGSVLENARKIFELCLPERIRVMQMLNDFIEHSLVNAVKNFDLIFKTDCVNYRVFNYTIQFDDISNIASAPEIKEHEYIQPKDNMKRLLQALSYYDDVVLDMGIANQKIPNVFRKEGTGKNRKSIPVTIKDIGDLVRITLETANTPEISKETI